MVIFSVSTLARRKGREGGLRWKEHLEVVGRK
jgi:hypothetical protein